MFWRRQIHKASGNFKSSVHQHTNSTNQNEQKKKKAMPLSLSDSKGVSGVWRGLIACFWCSVLINGWVTDTRIVLGTHIGSKPDPMLSEGQEMCVLFLTQ